MKPQYIILALVIFGFLIFIHEGGHYLFARLFKVTINEFAIGMGPKLVTKKSEKTGISYSLRALPIGGFVSMAGEDFDSDDPNAFCAKPVWQRMIITVAGAAINIIFGIIVMSLLVVSQDSLATTKIAAFNNIETSVTYESGLRVDDEIIKIGDKRIHIANELIYEIMRCGTEPLDVTVIRDGETLVIKNVVFPTDVSDGVVFGDTDFYVYGVPKTFGLVIKNSVFRATSTIEMIWESFYDLVTGRYGMEAVSGPVGVTEAIGEAAETSSMNLIYLTVVISMNLGIVNLLPFPALDGGRLLFQLIELVRRKRMKPEVEGYINFAGMVLLMILMVLITCKDIAGIIK